MCGICGILRLAPAGTELDLDALRRTRDAMAARGPDGVGEWRSPGGELALGHRRLAILDLSPAGAQPMADPSGRYRIVFNGEIYNFRELRAGLERAGVAFRTASDTEVILALWAREGERALARLRGMYALALWDEAEKCLTLARDPFGIKPLYHSSEGGVLRFASQVKALEAGGASRAVDPGGLAGFLLWGTVPEPWTIRRAIRAIPAGHLLTVRDGVVGESRPAPTLSGAAPESSAPAGLPAALDASVRAHLVSDVPVALFLSAGLDSALVAALASRAMPEPLRSITLTFDGWEGSPADEAPLARAVAQRLGLRHSEHRLGRADLLAAWQPAAAAMDQPSIDGFNTLLVARAAHEAGIKVALSGLGGDELFGSYPSFADVPRWAQRVAALDRLPGATRFASALAAAWDRNRPKAPGLFRYGSRLAGAYFVRRALFLPEELPDLMGRQLAEEGLAAHDPVAHAEGALETTAAPRGSAAPDPWQQVQRLEAALYMRNQLLRDSDWAAMASSVELRVPLVDGALWRAAAAARCEPARSHGKAALVRAVAPELPEALWNRPKTGFTVPIADWICPPRRGEAATPGAGSRRLARQILEAWGLCPAP